MRWIPKGMTVEYLKKATGTMRAVATPAQPIVEAAAGYDLPVDVVVTDPAGERCSARASRCGCRRGAERWHHSALGAALFALPLFQQ